MAKASGENKDLIQKVQGQQKNRPGSRVENTVKGLLNAPEIQTRFREILRDRAPQYMSSILNLVNNDPLLKQCDPMSVIAACMVAATMDLPVDRNLGYAWIIPYKDGKTGKLVAQFQMGWKGYVQLALRTGRYHKINAISIREGELVEWNPLTEDFVYDPGARKSDEVVGYVGFFRLINGFEKFVYWPAEKVEEHRRKFSKTDKAWKENYEAMALKTVVRNMLSKWGILSIEMQKAYATDEKAPVTNGTDDPLEVEWQYVEGEETDASTDEDGAQKDQEPPKSDAAQQQESQTVGLGLEDESIE